jgi:pimeloyl-ACP methyl ester carboxylesterase
MKPRVLLLAGMLNDARVWAPVARLLQSHCETRSLAFLEQASVEAMADHAWQATADMQPGQPLAVAGFSMGGYVAQAMIARPRRRIDALALVGSAIRAETAETRSNRLKTLRAIESDFPALVEQAARWGSHLSKHGDTAYMQALRTMMSEVGPQAAALQTRAIAERPDHRSAMQALSIPALVVCGRQDKVTPPELSQDAAQTIPGARLQWLEDSGHLVPLERPEVLAQELLQWLKPWLNTPEGDRA